jgi:hypothetical protein
VDSPITASASAESTPVEFISGDHSSSIIQFHNFTPTPASSSNVFGAGEPNSVRVLNLGDLEDSLPGLQTPGLSESLSPDADFFLSPELQLTNFNRGVPAPYFENGDSGTLSHFFQSPCTIIPKSERLVDLCFNNKVKLPSLQTSNLVESSAFPNSEPCQSYTSPVSCLNTRDLSVAQAMSNTANSSHLATRRMRSLRSHHHANNRPTLSEGDDVATNDADIDQRHRDRSESPIVRATITRHHHHRHHHHNSLRTSAENSELSSAAGGTDENLENLPSDCEDCDDCDNLGACGGGCDECDLIEHHSSEEELETLTGSWQRDVNGPPEKRKWSQVARLSLTDSGAYTFL